MVLVRVAARGTLYLAADPRRSCSSQSDAADDAARWTRLDAGLAKACETTVCCRMRCEDFAGAYRECMYLLFMRFVPKLSRPTQRH